MNKKLIVAGSLVVSLLAGSVTAFAAVPAAKNTAGSMTAKPAAKKVVTTKKVVPTKKVTTKPAK